MTKQFTQNKGDLRPRTKVRLDAKLDTSLLAYVAAASSAGVGLLALCQPAEAKIVYTSVNNVEVFSPVPIDLNNDGIADFEFNLRGYSHGAALFVYPYPGGVGNEMFGRPTPLGFNVPVGPAGMFQASESYMGDEFATSGNVGGGGPWYNVGTRYLGLKFYVQGRPHFGWVRINMRGIVATIEGYAYETIPNTAIRTGKTFGPTEKDEPKSESQSQLPALATRPASLGMLALGSTGIAVWRREKDITQ